MKFFGYVIGLVAFVILSAFFFPNGFVAQTPIALFLVPLAGIYLGCGIQSINEWVRRPVLLFGKYQRAAGPGLTWIDPIFHKTLADVNVSNMVSTFEIEGIQTHDNVPLTIMATLTMRVAENRVRDYVVNIGNDDDAIEERTQATLAEVIGGGALSAVLENREEFLLKARTELEKKIVTWGVEIIALEVSQITIEDEAIAQAISMKARATKEYEAELARANGQIEIAKKLSEAAKSYTDEAWRLKGLEVLVELTRSGNNNTILIPTELTSALGGQALAALAKRP